MDSTDRHIMWRNLIGERYNCMLQNQKKKTRETYAKARDMKPGDFQPIDVGVVNYPSNLTIGSNALKLGTLPTGTVVGTFYDPVNNFYDFLRLVTTEKKEETTMENLIQDTQRHLRNRLDRVANTKRYALDKAFFIDDETPPKNTEEALDRIAKGMYDVEKKDEDFGCDYDNWTDRLHWRNPANKPDRDGRKAAGERLQKAYQRAIDDIQVLTPEEGLKALREFEDTDFSKN